MLNFLLSFFYITLSGMQTYAIVRVVEIMVIIIASLDVVRRMDSKRRKEQKLPTSNAIIFPSSPLRVEPIGCRAQQG